MLKKSFHQNYGTFFYQEIESIMQQITFNALEKFLKGPSALKKNMKRIGVYIGRDEFDIRTYLEELYEKKAGISEQQKQDLTNILDCVLRQYENNKKNEIQERLGSIKELFEKILTSDNALIAKRSL